MAARLDVEINAKGAKAGAREARNSLNSVRDSARGADSAVQLFNKTLLITSAAAVFTATMAKAASASALFADSLAEVSTLVNKTFGPMERLSDASKEQAIEFGSLPVNQTQAFYQIISAGAGDAAEATDALTASNKLAVGGVTDVAIAADGLTTSYNAYGDTVSSITELSDAMFIGMKKGKTTIGELSANIGEVVSLGKTAGVSFDTLVASVATLTKTLPSTSQAVTQIKSLISAVVKPTSEARAEAAGLGLDFNLMGLRAKGLAGFLQEITERTEGNTESLSKLFGNVEALNAVLALTGASSADFADILTAMNEKLGATDEAFQDVSQAPGFASKQLRALSVVMLTDLGDAISGVLLPMMRFVIDDFDEIARTAGVAGTALLVAFGPQIIAGVSAAYVTGLGLMTTATNLLTAAIVANPLGAIAVVIAAGVSALILFSDEIELVKDDAITLRDVFVTMWDGFKSSVASAVGFWLDLWLTASNKIETWIFGSADAVEINMTDIISISKRGLNIVIGLFAGAYETVASNWSLLPDFFSSVIVSAVNLTIGGVEKAINFVVNIVADFLEDASRKAVETINFLIGLRNRIPFTNPVELLIVPEFRENEFQFQFDRIEDQAAGTATKIGENIKNTWKSALSRDFIGDFVTDFKRGVEETARLRRETESQLRTGRPAGRPEVPAAGETPADLTADQLAIVETAVADFSAKADEHFKDTFQGAYTERLAEMVDNTRTAVSAMGEAFAEVFGPGGTLQRGFADSAARAIVFGDDLQTSLVNLGKQITAQLISKFIQAQLAVTTMGGAIETMSATSSGAIIAGNTATTGAAVANQQIVASNAVSTNAQIAASAAPAAALESAATFGASATAGQIAFGVALTAMLALAARANGMIEFAKGGMFTNGIVDSPTVFPLGKMGEAGPEAILPLSRDSAGRLGVIAATAPREGGGQTVFAPVISVNIAGDAKREDADEIGRQVQRRLDFAMSEFIRKQQRPGGQLNRQRMF